MNSYLLAIRSHVGKLGAAFSVFTLKAWAITILTAAIGLVVIGPPAAIYENPFFVRMTPVRIHDYIIWVASSVLIGLIVGTYLVDESKVGEGKIVSGGMLSVLAVGCSVCNKPVVLLLGVSGTLTFFEPLRCTLGLPLSSC